MKVRRKLVERQKATQPEEHPKQQTKVSLPRWYTDEERVAWGFDLQTVYALVDPTAKDTGGMGGTIFYIGRTKNLLERYLQHVKGTNDGSEKDDRVAMITRSGHLPIMRTLWEAADDEEATFRESFYIEYYRAKGVKLLNRTLAISSIGDRGRAAYESEKWEEWYFGPRNMLGRMYDNLCTWMRGLHHKITKAGA